MVLFKLLFVWNRKSSSNKKILNSKLFCHQKYLIKVISNLCMHGNCTSDVVVVYCVCADETTCQALKRAASDAVVFNHLTHPENCSTTPGCLGIECIANLTKKRDTFSSLTLHPCTSPKSASMLMVYRDQLVLNESFTQSFVKSYLILNVVDFVLNVSFVDMNDSILIGVSVH